MVFPVAILIAAAGATTGWDGASEGGYVGATTQEAKRLTANGAEVGLGILAEALEAQTS